MELHEMWEAKLDEIFMELGFTYAMQGTVYLREMVAWYKPGKQFKEYYGTVGQLHKVSPGAVERAARYAIRRATGRLGYCFEAWAKYFGNSINPETGAPTVSEFVTRVWRLVCGPNT